MITLMILKKTIKNRYEALLEEQDPDLFQWFLKGAQPGSADLKRIVGIILDKVSC